MGHAEKGTPETVWALGRLLLTVLLLCGMVPATAQDTDGQRDIQSPEGQFRFAEGLYVRKFYDLAEKEFRFFVQNYPEHELAPQAMFRLIKCHRFQNDTEGTLSAINQFQARWPNHELAPKLFLWKGEILFGQKNYDVAASCFKRLVDSDDANVREASLYFLAQCYAFEGAGDKAVETYARIAALPFDDEHIYRPYALFAMAAAFQHEGSFDKAVAAFQRLIDEDHVPDGVREESMYRLAETHFARERFAKAIELFEALLVEYPEGLFTREARKRRAWAYFSMGEYAKAVEAAKDWRDRYGDSFDYEMDYIHGASLVGVGFYAESLPFFERIAQHADVPEEYRRLARFQQVVALLNLKQFEECARRADAFVSDFPNSSDAATVTFMAGESLWNLEKYEEAVTHFRRALDSYTGDWEYLETAHLRLANALERLGRYGEAAASYRELSQKNDVSRRATFRFRAGDCERKAGNVEAAIRDFETVIADFPNAEEEVHAAMLHLGELYSEGGDYDRAEKMVRGLMQAPNVTNPSRLRFFLGYLCYQQERYEEAVTHLTEALSGGDAGVIAGTAKFYLGGSLLELGKTDEALGYFADVLELPLDERPPFPAALLFRLEELYYIRNRFDVSESICRWLVTWDSGSVVYRAGLRLSDILVAQNRLQEAAAVLRDVQEKVASGALAFDEDQKPPKEEALAVLAEIYLREGKHDEAVRAAETCLNQPNLGIDYLTRARWVMGEILYREKHPKQALPYAVKCFVLADDPVYTPRAMLLAINIFIALDNQRDALTTWRELLERYPAFAEEKRGSPQIRELLDANPDRQDNADDQQP